MFRKKSYFKNFNCNDKDFQYKQDISSIFDYSNISNDGYIVQGFCVTDKYYLISAYYYNLSEKKNSRVYFYNKDTSIFCGYVNLDNTCHVGGITFDYLNRIVFITGSRGGINAYKYESLIKSLNGNYLEKIDTSELNISHELSGHVSAATIYYYDESLYVCTCSCSGSMVQYKVEYLKDFNKILVVDKNIYSCLPSCIQGLIVFSNCGKKYYLVSQSFSKLKSIIKLYDFDGNFLGQKIIGFKGLEGIDMDRYGNIHGIFEFGLTKSYVLNIKDVCGKINKGLENKYILKGKMHQKKLDTIK